MDLLTYGGLVRPVNKHERLKVGIRKGKRRADGLLGNDEYVTEEFKEKQSRFLRDTTKLCSCEMCRNPRRSKWANKKDRITMQEKRAQVAKLAEAPG